MEVSRDDLVLIIKALRFYADGHPEEQDLALEAAKGYEWELDTHYRPRPPG